MLSGASVSYIQIWENQISQSNNQLYSKLWITYRQCLHLEQFLKYSCHGKL